MSPAILRRPARALLAAATTLAALLGVPSRVAAQEPDAAAQEPVPTLPDGSRRVQGSVVLARDSGVSPVPGTWVTLHRVASDSAGALDSTRTDARGAFAFRYRPFGASDAIYFVSTSYAGIAYFTRPLRLADVRGDDAEIAVYDTTSLPIAISVRGRHAVVSAVEGEGMRTVLEVFELSNDTSVTAVVPAAGGRGTWTVALPAGARDVQLRQGEVSEDAVRITSDRVTLLAPFGPGLKQVAFSYRVPADAFPLTLAIEGATSVLEVLVEDPAGTARGAKLTAVTPVTLEGRSFRRFLAQEVPAGSAVELDVPAGEKVGGVTRFAVPGTIVAVGLLMLGALAMSSRRKAATPAPAAPLPEPPPAPVVPALDDETARLAREIAALDDAHAEGAGEGAEADYATRRAELKRRLAAALAGAGARH